MSLALLTLGLLSAPPVQAQGPGGWQLDHYECTGADTWTDGDGGHTNPWPATTTSQLAFGHQYGSPDQSVGTVTAVFTWQGGGQPTDRIPLVITSYADAAGAPFGPPADDGFGDPGNGNGENCSAGMHLVKVANPDHKATVKTRPYSLSAICGSSGYTTWVTFQASIDTSDTPRDVTITSSIDPTYHRETDSSGKPSKKENTPDAAGTVKADSVNLWDTQPEPMITYFGHPTGSWDPGSSYHWYSAVTGYFDAGTFAPPSFFVDGYPPSITGQEHVNLNCTDLSDGANASANYYVTFHPKYSDWYRDPSKTVDHPLPLVSNGVVNGSGDWTYMFFIDNNSPNPITQNLKQDVTVKKTMQGTIGGQASGPVEAATLQANESITIGHETSKTFSVDTAFTGHAYTRTEFYEGQSWEERTGTCSVYGINGYQNDATWNGVYVSDPATASPGANLVTYYPGYKP